MSCDTCLPNKCHANTYEHYESGCKFNCGCRASNKELTGQVPTLKDFDPGPNIVKRYLKRHKRVDKAVFEFSIVWWLIASAFMAFAAGVFFDKPYIPQYLPWVTLAYSPIFAYLVYKVSDQNIRKDLISRIKALESKVG